MLQHPGCITGRSERRLCKSKVPGEVDYLLFCVPLTTNTISVATICINMPCLSIIGFSGIVLNAFSRSIIPVTAKHSASITSSKHFFSLLSLLTKVLLSYRNNGLIAFISRISLRERNLEAYIIYQASTFDMLTYILFSPRDTILLFVSSLLLVFFSVVT